MSKIGKLSNFISTHPLTADTYWSGMLRVMRWQVLSRFRKGFTALPYGQKSHLLAKKGMTGATGNYYAGLHEFYDMSFLLHFLREGDTFIDVGANVGSYTVLAANECRAKVYAYEPLQATFERLVANVKYNRLEELVTANNIGVGSSPGILEFTSSRGAMNHVSVDQSGKGIQVEVFRLDDLVMLQSPTLVKIDVEGFETEVIKGMSNMLTSPHLKAIIIELNGLGKRYGYNDLDIHHSLVEQGFTAIKYWPKKRKYDVLEAPLKLNTIYVRDIAFMEERIASSPELDILGCAY